MREEFARPEAAPRSHRREAPVADDLGDAFIVPDGAGPLLEQLRTMVGADDPAVRSRTAQAAEFLSDWNRLSGAMASYEPHLGACDDVLPWPRIASAVALRVLGPALATQLNAEWATKGRAARNRPGLRRSHRRGSRRVQRLRQGWGGA